MIKFGIVSGSHMLPSRTMFAINDARAPDPPWATTLGSLAHFLRLNFIRSATNLLSTRFPCLYKARVPRLFLLYTSPHQTGVLMPLEATILIRFAKFLRQPSPNADVFSTLLFDHTSHQSTLTTPHLSPNTPNNPLSHQPPPPRTRS
jgi:hypothetical protein